MLDLVQSQAINQRLGLPLQRCKKRLAMRMACKATTIGGKRLIIVMERLIDRLVLFALRGLVPRMRLDALLVKSLPFLPAPRDIRNFRGCGRVGDEYCVSGCHKDKKGIRDIHDK